MRNILYLLLLIASIGRSQNFCIGSYDYSITQGLPAKINFIFAPWNGFGACDSMSIRIDTVFIKGNKIVDRFTTYQMVTDTLNPSCSTQHDSICGLNYVVPFSVPSGPQNYYFDLWKNGAFQTNQSVAIYITASAFSVQSYMPPRELIHTEHYTITGTQIVAPGLGITIVLRYYSDGTVERKKQFVVE